MESVMAIVDKFAPQPGLIKVVGDSLATRRCLLFPFVTLLLFLGSVDRSAVAAVNAGNTPATSFGPESQFAIADFDGDVRPDLASIEAGLSSSGNTNYWIRLQLSAAGPQSIHLVAPAGGLLIEARDVNGDHAVDLVLATAWHRQLVAVLLNDGHGSFSRAEPATFPEAFIQSDNIWDTTPSQGAEAVGAPPQSCGGICLEAKSQLYDRSPGGLIRLSSSRFAVCPFLISHAVRAPPSEVPHC